VHVNKRTLPPFSFNASAPAANADVETEEFLLILFVLLLLLLEGLFLSVIKMFTFSINFSKAER
jgi:hypothetical protein